MKRWDEVNALYQIYLRSFKDSNGDGVGDLRGIIEKLDYLAERFDAIWLSPFFASPQKDFGYDVSNYRAVDGVYGLPLDVLNLISRAHARGLKIIFDFIPNHTSDQHAWFQESRSSRDSMKRNWYVWRDPKADGNPPNNWISMSGGSAWQYDEPTSQYYLHSFLSSQPDLNWDNPDVREQMKKEMRFWLDQGIDGFRVDAVWLLSKSEILVDDTLRTGANPDHATFGDFAHVSCRNGAHVTKYLGEMAAVAAEYQDVKLIFEYYPTPEFGDPFSQIYALQNVNPSIATTFFFEIMQWPLNAHAFGQGVADYLGGLPAGAVPVFCFGNHDQPRIVTRWGGEDKARLIALLQLTLPGIPTIYYGEELGMTNFVLPPEAKKDLFRAEGSMAGRDPERTPMQWEDTKNAGFSLADTWLPVNQNYHEINAHDEQSRDTSMLALYDLLLKLRRDDQTLRHGRFMLLGYDNDILAFERTDDSVCYRVLANFSREKQKVGVPQGSILCSSQKVTRIDQPHDGWLELEPHEAILIRIS